LAAELTILGIDALDYDLVIEYNLKKIKQSWCSRLTVPYLEGKEPHSPQVWSSFLSGYDVGPQTMGQSYKREWLYEGMKAFKKLFGLKKSYGIGRKISPMEVARTFLPINHNTLLDQKEVEYLNAPGYNFDNSSFKLCYKWASNQIEMEELRQSLRELLDTRLKTVIREIRNRNCKVFFAYIHALDSLQHISMKPSQVREDYLMINEVTGIISGNVKELIILSDHGYNFEKRLHSMQGFISSNTGETPDNIIELRQFIEKKYLQTS
jgi:hypothetical protein